MKELDNNCSVKINLLLDPVSYQAKPDKENIKLINFRIVNNPVELTIQELAKEITFPNGKTWMPAVSKTKRSNEGWKSQQIFALDFDLGITLNAALTRLKEYGLNCTFAYETFSSSLETPKFRMIWQLNQVVIDRVFRDSLQEQLMILFPEADKNCRDAARVFFGGKKLIYENYDYYLDLDILLSAVRCWATSDSSSKNVGRDLQRLDKKIEGKKLRKNDKFYIYNIEFNRFPPNSDTSDSDQTLDSDKKDNQLFQIPIAILAKRIKILDDLIKGKWLYHQQLFGLATNLVYIHGGAKIFKECLDKNPNYTKDKYILPSVVKHYNYKPMNLHNFSPYEEDFIYTNLLQAYQQNVVRLSEYITIPLEEAESKFNEEFKLALEADNTDVYVFRVATGLGKTSAYLDLEGVTIALPNHALKDEIKTRFKKNCLATPHLPAELSIEIKNKLNYYYSIGAISEVNRYLSNQAKSSGILKDYRENTFSCYNSDDTVLTTHQKALFIEFKHKTLIFDEDPLQSILKINSTTINDFYRLIGELKDIDDAQTIETIDVIKSYLSYIENSLLNSPINTKLMSLNYELIENIVLKSNLPWDGNILQFFDSDFFVVDAHDKATINFIKNNPLPSNKKIIILSATANEFIYKKLLGDRLHFYDLSNVELTGMIEQDTKYSYSRQSLQQHLEETVDRVGDLPTITFANYKHKFINPVEECHFGKTSGFDGLKGKDIAVAGLPHINQIMYLLYAQVLGIKFKSSDFKMHYQKVKHNNLEFPIQTYDNEGLRQLQFFCIESELRQAVGRARVLREPARVLLLAGYPLPEACLTEKEKMINTNKVKNLRLDKVLVNN